MGWGGHAPKPLIGESMKSLKKRVAMVMTSESTPLDVWRIRVTIEDDGKFLEVKDSKEVVATKETESKEASQEMINYFSCGADAEAVFGFEKNRRHGQVANKLEYTRQGGLQTFIRPQRLKKFIKDIKAGQDEFSVKYRETDRSVIFQNIPSYGGGQDIWSTIRKSRVGGFLDQEVGDGKLEAMTLRASSDVGLSIATGGFSKEVFYGIKRVAQESKYVIEFKPKSTVYMQFDGEVMKVVNPSRVVIEHGYQVNMLNNFGFDLANIHTRVVGTLSDEFEIIRKQEVKIQTLEQEIAQLRDQIKDMEQSGNSDGKAHDEETIMDEEKDSTGSEESSSTEKMDSKDDDEVTESTTNNEDSKETDALPSDNTNPPKEEQQENQAK